MLPSCLQSAGFLYLTQPTAPARLSVFFSVFSSFRPPFMTLLRIHNHRYHSIPCPGTAGRRTGVHHIPGTCPRSCLQAYRASFRVNHKMPAWSVPPSYSRRLARLPLWYYRAIRPRTLADSPRSDSRFTSALPDRFNGLLPKGTGTL